MNAKEFEAVVENRIAVCRKVLLEKNEEYSRDSERLHNFKTAARMNNCTPEQALWGMWTKHLVSISDMIHDAAGGRIPSKKMLDEKVTDTINYALLFDGLMSERILDAAVNDAIVARWQTPGISFDDDFTEKVPDDSIAGRRKNAK
jgi:hypothetical protein